MVRTYDIRLVQSAPGRCVLGEGFGRGLAEQPSCPTGHRGLDGCMPCDG